MDNRKLLEELAGTYFMELSKTENKGSIPKDIRKATIDNYLTGKNLNDYTIFQNRQRFRALDMFLGNIGLQYDQGHRYLPQGQIHLAGLSGGSLGLLVGYLASYDWSNPSAFALCMTTMIVGGVAAVKAAKYFFGNDPLSEAIENYAGLLDDLENPDRSGKNSD